MPGQYAFVTLISSDAYLPGALAQVAALRDIHTIPPSPPELPFQTVCLVTPETVDVATIKLLRRAFDLVVGVEVLEQENNTNLKLLGQYLLFSPFTHKKHTLRVGSPSSLGTVATSDGEHYRSLGKILEAPHSPLQKVSISTPLTAY